LRTGQRIGEAKARIKNKMITSRIQKVLNKKKQKNKIILNLVNSLTMEVNLVKVERKI
jgi:hypothetical protein